MADQPDIGGVRLDPQTIDTIKRQQSGKATKIINLVKAIQKTAEENSDDPFLIAMAERTQAVQDRFEDRQTELKRPLRLSLKPSSAMSSAGVSR